LAITKAGNLGCKNIIHVNMPEYCASSCVEDIKSKIYDCPIHVSYVVRAHSVAFPALGTGGLRYLVEETAKYMLKHVKGWLKSHRNSELERVSFVVVLLDTKTVQGEF